ncbi:exported hypothetical protein [Microbacterium sp. C448]|uniref:hypothetical protein n=1 Tax=Microbacterium sp. C448 TaxID=1177594 RepID=UPI0003DE5542|nr:hypothetical protein [Microbacterium sp. C448]CDJ99465.1 exported hypothetical protein [Microbacterium sp. C448]
MRKNTTRIGMMGAAGLGAAALAVAGFAIPANAAESTTEDTSTRTSVTGMFDIVDDLLAGVSAGDLVVSPDTNAGNVGVDGGIINAPSVEGPVVSDSLNGDVLSGNDTPIGSGNKVQAPVDAPIGSGNDIDVPVEAPVEAPVGSGNDTDTSVGDIGGVGMLGDILG